jgi:hypothetical protein
MEVKVFIKSEEEDYNAIQRVSIVPGKIPEQKYRLAFNLRNAKNQNKKISNPKSLINKICR